MDAGGMNDPVDVLIVGGGLVGASLAVALAPLPLRVALVEAVAFDAPAQPSFDERTTALSNASRRVFEALELWRDISPAATPIERIHISDRGRFGFARIEAAQQGHVPWIRRAESRARPCPVAGAPGAAASVGLRTRSVKVVRIEPGPDSVAVEIRRADGATAAIGARLVVAADGAKSAVRAAFGVSSQVRDYGQTAVITTVQPQQFHGFTAYERFTDEGPLALLPLADGRCGAVLTLAHARARQALGWSDAQYLAELQSRFGFRLGRFVKAGRRVGYPLALMQSAATSAPRCIIMGNAAQSLHPVAGMGFNLGAMPLAWLKSSPTAKAPPIAARRRCSRAMMRGVRRTGAASSASPIRWSACSATRWNRYGCCATQGCWPSICCHQPRPRCRGWPPGRRWPRASPVECR